MKEARQKLLFLCSRNRWRSPTAQRLFAKSERFEARSAGLASSAVHRLSQADIAWADVIFVMEPEHRRKLMQSFRNELADRPVHVLDIPDDYGFMDPELVELIHDGVAACLD